MTAGSAVSDSTVLIHYARADRLPLLHRVFDEVVAPSTVRDECLPDILGRADVVRLRESFEEQWVRVEDPRPQEVGRIAERHPQLDDGERDALALARSKPGWSFLTDDKMARLSAVLDGVPLVGSVGIAGLAFKQGQLASREAVAAVIEDLLAAGLWVGPDVVERFWSRLGGRP